MISALRQGTAETRKRSHGVPTRIGRAVNAGLVAFFGIFFDVIAFVINLGLAIAGLVAGPGRALLARLVAFGALVSRVADAGAGARRWSSPGAAILLALSQFADYRGVSIGTDAYSDVRPGRSRPDDRSQGDRRRRTPT